MQADTVAVGSPLEVRDIGLEDRDLVLESHTLLRRIMGDAKVEDLDSFLDTISPSTDPSIIPHAVCLLREGTVVGVTVGAYMVRPNVGFVAYAAVDEEWRRRGLYTELRSRMVSLFQTDAVDNRKAETPFVVSEMDKGSFLLRRFVDRGGAFVMPCEYEQPAVQGLGSRALELVVQPRKPNQAEALSIVRELFRGIYRIRDPEADQAFRRVADSLRRTG